MKKTILTIILAVVPFFGPEAISQTSYSESTEYKPREFAPDKKDRKKKSDEKDKAATAPVLNVAGDITVTIPVAFLDLSGSAVAGLKKEEVSVFVDGTEVPIAAFEQDKEPVTMILVLDSSPSAELKFKTMQEQALKLVRALPSNMKVMVVDFNDRFKLRSQPSTDREDTRKAISKVTMGGGTAIYSAVQFMYEKLMPQIPGRKIVLLMTDGVDTTSRKSDFASSLSEVEKEDVTIYPIYIDTFGDNARARKLTNDWAAQILRQNNIHSVGNSEADYRKGVFYLNDMAVASGGRIFSSEKLDEGTKSLLGELANRYYITVTVPRKNAGSRPVRVRVNRRSLAVFARGSFVEK
jgi:VWFA-related protein